VIDEWKNALHKVSEISGAVLNESQGDQGKVWEEIANTVLKEVKRRSYLKVADHPVGLEEAVYDFDRRRERENNPKLVGIVGMCGSGKTTLATELSTSNVLHLMPRVFSLTCAKHQLRIIYQISKDIC